MRSAFFAGKFSLQSSMPTEAGAPPLPCPACGGRWAACRLSAAAGFLRGVVAQGQESKATATAQRPPRQPGPPGGADQGLPRAPPSTPKVSTWVSLFGPPQQSPNSLAVPDFQKGCQGGCVFLGNACSLFGLSIWQPVGVCCAAGAAVLQGFWVLPGPGHCLSRSSPYPPRRPQAQFQPGDPVKGGGSAFFQSPGVFPASELVPLRISDKTNKGGVRFFFPSPRGPASEETLGLLAGVGGRYLFFFLSE